MSKEHNSQANVKLTDPFVESLSNEVRMEEASWRGDPAIAAEGMNHEEVSNLLQEEQQDHKQTKEFLKRSEAYAWKSSTNGDP